MRTWSRATPFRCRRTNNSRPNQTLSSYRPASLGPPDTRVSFLWMSRSEMEHTHNITSPRGTGAHGKNRNHGMAEEWQPDVFLYSGSGRHMRLIFEQGHADMFIDTFLTQFPLLPLSPSVSLSLALPHSLPPDPLPLFSPSEFRRTKRGNTGKTADVRRPQGSITVP